ncbi:MAG: DUF455 family protein [Burkholderiales bacterium]
MSGAAQAGQHAPARDGRFRVVESWGELTRFEQDDPRRRIEFFHRQMNEEVDSLECSARCLTDFPREAWDLRMSLARQCADEARHARMFRGFVERHGGHVGQFPVINFQYRITTVIDSLIGRLAVQNRSFEAGGMDAIAAEIAYARERGNTAELDLFEAQLADEISHVRFANERINAAIRDDPRQVLAVGRALAASAALFGEVIGASGVAGATYAADRQARLEAGFRGDEIDLASALANQRRAPAGAGD